MKGGKTERATCAEVQAQPGYGTCTMSIDARKEAGREAHDVTGKNPEWQAKRSRLDPWTQ